jgi:hypothetical protein
VLSRLRVNPISAPAITPGAAIGRVMSLNRCQAFAPRSAPASSRDLSTVPIRARMMKVTTARENIAWLMTRRTMPLFTGLMPQSTPRVTNHGRKEIPSTSSGVVSVSASSPVSPAAHHAPFRARARAIPPSVPRIVASRAEKNAALRLVITEFTMISLLIALV